MTNGNERFRFPALVGEVRRVPAVYLIFAGTPPCVYPPNCYIRHAMDCGTLYGLTVHVE